MIGLSKTGSGLVIAGIAGFVLIGAYQSIYGPALPIYGLRYGLGPAATGALVSAHWVGALAGVALMALRLRVQTRGALGLLVAGLGVLALQGPWAAMLAGAAVAGMGYGLVSTLYNRAFLIGFGTRGPAMVGILNATFGLGAIGGPILLLAAGSAPAPAFALLAVAGLALMPFSPPAAGAAPALAEGPLRLRPALLLGALAISCESALTGLGPSGLVARGVAEPQAAGLSSAFFAAFLGGRAALYWIAVLLPPRRLLALAALGVGLCALGSATLAPGAFYVASGAFAGLLFPAYFVAATREMGDGPRASAVVLAAGLVGGVLTPVWMGAVMAATGPRVLFPLIACLALATAGGILAARRSTPVA